MNAIKVLLAALSCVLVTCIELTAAQTEAVQATPVLRCGLHVSKMGKLDPHFAAGSQDRALADMVFNGLLRYQPGNAHQIEADLAESIPEFEMIGGKQVWTVTLKKGVMFQAGPKTPAYELSAEDVVFSLMKSADPEHSAYSGDYQDMVATGIDRYTIRITLAQPLSPVLFFPKITGYAGGFIVSKKAVEAMGYEEFAAHPVGTGPFAFKHYDPDSKLVLEAHRDYFRGPPQLRGIELHFLPQEEERENGLKDGTLDVIMGSGAIGWLDKISALDDVTLDIFGVGEVASFYFNTTIPPFDDVRVRKAVAYALDREPFIQTMEKGLAEKVFSQVPSDFLPGGISAALARTLELDYPKNLKKARQLLSEAGHPDGFSIELVSSEKRIYRSIYETLKKQLAEIGIQCSLKIVPHADMHKLIRSTPQPITLYIGWRPNADVFLTRFFHSDSIIQSGTKPDTNFSAYRAIDELIENARLEINPTKQIQLWEQAQIRILSDMAAFPVLISSQLFVRRSTVDYGHKLQSSMALYPQFDENTTIRH